jgi:hypothetical protein
MAILSWYSGNATTDPSYSLYPFAIWIVVLGTLDTLSACVIYVPAVFEVLELGFTAVPLGKAARSRNANIGLYSKGSWPFTHVSTLDEILTNRGASYQIRIEAGPYHEEVLPQGGSKHIHISEKVRIQTTHVIIAPPYDSDDRGTESINAKSQSVGS